MIQIPVNQGVDGSLYPSESGIGMAEVHYNLDPVEVKTAIIRFNGLNQAVVTFDALGVMPVSYTLLNIMATQVDVQSVENIIHHISNNCIV